MWRLCELSKIIIRRVVPFHTFLSQGIILLIDVADAWADRRISLAVVVHGKILRYKISGQTKFQAVKLKIDMVEKRLLSR